MYDISFDGKAALSYWGLDLEQCYVSAPQRKTYMIDIPAGNGQIDAMRGFGEPVYQMRTLTAVCSIAGNQDEVVNRLLRELEGREVAIVTPDNPDYYWYGSAHLQGAGRRTGDEITIVSTVFPWRRARQETVHQVPASDTAAEYTWYNSGARAVVPELTVADAAVAISAGGMSITLQPGIYNLSELKIYGGAVLTVQVSGGALTAKYREAIL